MERRGWIVALGAVALIGVGLYIWLRDSHATRHTHSVAGDEVARVGGASHGGGSGGATVADGGGRPVASRRRYRGDGGVVRVRPRPDLAPPGAVRDDSPLVGRGFRRNANDANHSAGWRLGQVRVRMEILEGLVERYQTAYDGFEAAGNTGSATRQRVTLDRVTTRLAGMRELETELREEAQRDGTMGEVQTGYEDGEPTTVRSIGASRGGTR